VRDILARAAALPETPRVDRRVPELDDPDIREVPAHSWRVIYQIRGEEVFARRCGTPTLPLRSALRDTHSFPLFPLNALLRPVNVS